LGEKLDWLEHKDYQWAFQLFGGVEASQILIPRGLLTWRCSKIKNSGAGSGYLVICIYKTICNTFF
jgi:hypothetical protein